MAKIEKIMPPTKNAALVLTLEKSRESSGVETTLSPFDIAAEKLADHPGWDGFFESYHEMKRSQEHKSEEGS